MITTLKIKQEQLSSGYFTTGTGSEVMLIMGSCRAVPYINYLEKWNEENGNRFTINFIDPFNWHWDSLDKRTDYATELANQESNPQLLLMLKSVNIFVHEYYANAGMFNCFKNGEKSIYDFGMNAAIDVTLPNYNDIFILTADIVAFDPEARKLAIQDMNVIGKLSDETLAYIEKIRYENIERFNGICGKSDFPEFAETFNQGYKNKRYFWNFNHVAKFFTLEIFRLLNDRFLKLAVTEQYLSEISKHDMYANNYTYLCQYDYGYNWEEEIKELKL